MEKKKNSIRAVVAANIKDSRGDIFTSKSLRKLEGKNLSYPVTENFDNVKGPIGKVEELKYRHGKLIATIRLSEDAKLKDKIFRVWGRIISARKEKNTKVIEDWDIFGVGMIDKENDVYPSQPKRKDKDRIKFKEKK